jgi:hypothetical protein
MADKEHEFATGEESQYEINPTATRYLTPDMAKIHLGSRGALHVTVKNDRIYGGVYAVYMFPVRHPNRWVSLRHITSKEEDIEVGIVKEMTQWPQEQRELLEEALARHYFIHTITAIRHVGWKFGFVSFDVETDKGPASFMMRWQTDRAVDYGRRGKILLDVDENRYLIPDLDAMELSQREEFQRYIYW